MSDYNAQKAIVECNLKWCHFRLERDRKRLPLVLHKIKKLKEEMHRLLKQIKSDTNYVELETELGLVDNLELNDKNETI